MKFLLLSAIASVGLFGAQTFAHDIHNVASDHTHPGNYYTHSVSSDYDHHKAHNTYNKYGYSNNYHNRYTRYNLPKVTTNTATYYTRSYPVKNTYTYYTTPNTTIHQPPFAYSSCAGNCQNQPKRIMVSSKIGQKDYTYRAPSEYKASCAHRYVGTPQKITNGCRSSHRTTYASPYKTHKLTTCSSCRSCSY